MSSAQSLDSLDQTCRRELREAVEWIATCEVNGNRWAGVVRDLTTTGAFFQAQHCLTTGARVNQEGAGDVASRSDAALLTLSQDVAPDVVFEFSGVVRWSGQSDHHGCGGFGMRFEQGPRLLEHA